MKELEKRFNSIGQMSQNLFEGDFERELIVAVRCVAINRIRRIIEKYF